MVLNDPDDPNFVLPRYFLLVAELDQFDRAPEYELEQISQKDQQIARILSLFNKKPKHFTVSLSPVAMYTIRRHLPDLPKH